MGNAFNINKCQIIQVGSKNIKKDNEMCGIKIKSVHSFKDLVFTVASNLKFSQQCNEMVKKANQIMALIKKKNSFRNKDVVLPLHNTFVRSYLEYAVQFWFSHHGRDIAESRPEQSR